MGWFAWFVKNPRVLLPGVYIMLLSLGAIFGPLFLAGDPGAMRPGDQFLPAGPGGWLGTDEYGRDIFIRILHGSQITLAVSLASILLAAIAGVAMGVAAAFFRHPTDMILMRLADAILCYPPILMAIFVVSLLGSSLFNIIIVIAVLYTPRFTRIAYSATLSVQEKEFIEAARALGAPALRIIGLTILPNIMAPILVQGSLAMGHAILLESGLSFLGLGPPVDLPSWGRMIQQSSRFMNISAHGVIWPSLVISMTVLSFNILGDALRDRLDPRLRT